MAFKRVVWQISERAVAEMYRFNISKHRYFAQPSDTPFPKKNDAPQKEDKIIFRPKQPPKKKTKTDPNAISLRFLKR